MDVKSVAQQSRKLTVTALVQANTSDLPHPHLWSQQRPMENLDISLLRPNADPFHPYEAEWQRRPKGSQDFLPPYFSSGGVNGEDPVRSQNSYLYQPIFSGKKHDLTTLGYQQRPRGKLLFPSRSNKVVPTLHFTGTMLEKPSQKQGLN